MRALAPPPPSPLPIASLAALVAANLIPLFGVLFGGWDAATVLVLYWLETAIVGIGTLARILCCRSAPVAVRLVTMPFFCFHFGLFMLVHGMFLTFLLGFRDGGFDPLGTLRTLVASAGASSAFTFAVAGLVLSHAASFAINYLGRGEYARVPLAQVVTAPYGRIVVMHVTILFGAFAAIALGASTPLVVLLVVVKTAVDVGAHVAERRRFAALATAAAATGTT